MKIGIISDTHGRIPVKVFDHFDGVELIVHAGDIGSEEILTDLRTIAPVKAVVGNTDRFPLVANLPEIDFFNRNGWRICVTHITGSEKGFAYRLFKMDQQADIVISGHTHQNTHRIYNKIHFINPGSVTAPRSGPEGTLALLQLEQGKIDVQFLTV